MTIAMMKYANNHNVSDYSNLCVLGFENGYHGNSIATMSASGDLANE